MSSTEAESKVVDALRTDLAHDPEGRAIALLKRFFELQRQFKELKKKTPAAQLSLRADNSPKTRKALIRHRMNVIKVTEQTTAVAKEVMMYFQEANKESAKVIDETTKVLVTECAEKKDRLEVLEEHESLFVSEFKKRCEPLAKDNPMLDDMIKDNNKITRNALKAMYCMSLADDYVSLPDDWRIAYEIQDVKAVSQHVAATGSAQANGKKK